MTSTYLTLVQIDHTYFIQSSEAKHGSSKAAKAAVEMPLAPLPVLFRPQGSKPSKTKSQVRSGTDETPINNRTDVSQPKSHVIGVKRVAEVSSSDKGDVKRPNQPPTKRVKKEPNLFIPKNKKA